MNIPLGVNMGVRLLIASASLLLMSVLPASADWDRGRDWGWNGGDRHYQADGLRRACSYGDRRACVRLGEVIGRHREDRRQQEWRHDRFAQDRFGPDRFAMPNRYYEERSRYYRPPPPPSFYWRFDSR